jgi:hypothetical protein
VKSDGTDTVFLSAKSGPSRSRRLLGIVWAIAVAGCASGSEQEIEDDVGMVQSALVPSDCGSVTQCGDALHVNFDYGRWPGGVIQYRFHSNLPTEMRQAVRQAMADWVRISGNTLTFEETNAASTPYAPVVTIRVPITGGLGQPFQNCSAWGGCDLFVNQDLAYHELGHVIGFPHGHQRNDRIHYLTFYRGTPTQRDNCGDDQWDRYPNTLHDFGPFDFFSSLSYPNTYPQMARWNGQPMLSNAVCSQAEFAPAPVCPPGDVSSIFCSTCGPGAAWLGAGDLSCPLRRPFGVPSRGDGSAVDRAGSREPAAT